MAWPYPPFNFTLEELAPIRAAYLTGATRVAIGDRDVTFRSLAEMQAILVASMPPVQGTRRVVLIGDKGL